jgi:hypothetical protein
VELIAVTKGFGRDAIDAAVAAGCRSIGENYAQELVAKLAADDSPHPPQEPQPTTSVRPVVHFIGQLQTNKVRTIATLVDVWQTVDRAGLADEIARRAPHARVFVQVNTTAEDAKGGCPPHATATLVEHCRTNDLVVEGLMTVGPTSVDVAATHAAFALLDSLADDVGVAGRSMGMSADFEIGIAHGATHVRIGSALFGTRPHRRAQIG